MSASRRRAPAALAVGLLLVAIGLVLWALYHVAATREQHSFTPGNAPPPTVQLHNGTKYRLAIAGGVAAELKVGVSPESLRCTAQLVDGTVSRLSLSPEQADTKATDQIASFTASSTGRAHLACAGLSEVYVDNVASDPSGYLLVLATGALVTGAPLVLSGLRRRTTALAAAPPAPAPVAD